MCLYPLLFKQAVGWATGALQAQFEDVFRRVEGTLKDVNEDVIKNLFKVCCAIVNIKPKQRGRNPLENSVLKSCLF
mgnify:CR=1 FL=1